MFDLFVIQQWYEERSSRERVLVCFLGFLFIYSLAFTFLELPLKSLSSYFASKIEIENKIQDELKSKIMVFEKINESSIYKQWINNKALAKAIELEYSKKITSVNSKELDQMIRLVLSIYPSININRVKTLELKKADIHSIQSLKGTISERVIVVEFAATYGQTYDYLVALEKKLPYARWRSLSYQMVNYPTANVELAFSVLYKG